VKIRIATRASALALTQTRWVAHRIRQVNPHVEIEEVHVTTKGDQVLDKPLASIGGKGLFVAEVGAIVARGDADIAVHSLKDVPGDIELAEGMALVCLPEREQPNDVLITPEGVELDALPAGGRVGTTSLRRTAQLKARRPDLRFDTLRGNVGTRLSRLDEGRFDAIVLAAAGLRRLDLLKGRPHWIIPTDLCLPAVGQGTLAIEGWAEDEAMRALLAPLEHAPTRTVTEAERALLKRLQGSCRVPMAGHARLLDSGARLSIHAMVGSIDGERILSAAGDHYLAGRNHELRLEEARELGTRVAEALVEQGAVELMQEAEAAVLRRERSGNGGGSGGDRFTWS